MIQLNKFGSFALVVRYPNEYNIGDVTVSNWDNFDEWIRNNPDTQSFRLNRNRGRTVREHIVYINGLRLMENEDYTIDNSGSIRLRYGLSLNPDDLFSITEIVTSDDGITYDTRSAYGSQGVNNVSARPT